MLLRVMLVGMVTSLGMELPTGPEVDAWTRAGRDWCQTRLAGWDAPMPTDELAFASDPAGPPVEAIQPAPTAELTDPVEPSQPAEIATSVEIAPALAETPTVEIAPTADASLADDLAFSSLIEETVMNFAAESFAEEAARVLASLPVAGDESRDDPMVAIELGREAERPIEAAMAEAVATVVAAVDEVTLTPAFVPEPAAVSAEMPGPARGERLAAAVRLTSQAVHAWAGLLRGATAISLNP